MLAKHAHTDDVYDVNKIFNLLQEYKNDEFSDIKQYYSQYRKPLFDIVMTKLQELLSEGSGQPRPPQNNSQQPDSQTVVPTKDQTKEPNINPESIQSTDIEELKALLNAELQSADLDFKTRKEHKEVLEYIKQHESEHRSISGGNQIHKAVPELAKIEAEHHENQTADPKDSGD